MVISTIHRAKYYTEKTISDLRIRTEYYDEITFSLLQLIRAHLWPYKMTKQNSQQFFDI